MKLKKVIKYIISILLILVFILYEVRMSILFKSNPDEFQKFKNSVMEHK